MERNFAPGVAVVARYPRRMDGRWRTSYVVTAVTSLYFNVAVRNIQSFQKMPILQSLSFAWTTVKSNFLCT
jgi:hypothetical protein